MPFQQLAISLRFKSKEFELKSNQITEAIAENKQLGQYPPEVFIRSHDILIEYGFNTETILDVFKSYHEVLRFQPSVLKNRLEYWRGLQFGDFQMRQLIERYPELLQFKDENFLRNRVAELETYAHKRRNVWRMIMESPNVLTDNLKLLNEKIEYLDRVMRVDITNAVKSTVFAHPLAKLRTRHMLLVRVGAWKPKSKKENPLDPNKNPRLHRIMDSEDKEFANRLCGISLLEFEAFAELFERELREQKVTANYYGNMGAQADDDEDEAAEGSDLDDEEEETDDEFKPEDEVYK